MRTRNAFFLLAIAAGATHQDDLSNGMANACGSDAIAEIESNARSESGLTGLTKSLGNPNIVRRILDNPLEFTTFKDYAVEYARSLGLWYFFLAVALVWFILSIWSCSALNHPRCRRCTAECFCGLVCKDRDRAKPIQEIVDWKVITLQVFSLIFVVFSFATFTLCIIGYSARLNSDTEKFVCTSHSSPYELLYGGRTSEWDGLVDVTLTMDETVLMFAPETGNWTVRFLDHTKGSRDDVQADFGEINTEAHALVRNSLDVTALRMVVPREWNAAEGRVTLGQRHLSVELLGPLVDLDDLDEREQQIIEETDEIVDTANEICGKDGALGDMVGHLDDAKPAVDDLVKLVQDFSKDVMRFYDEVDKIFTDYPEAQAGFNLTWTIPLAIALVLSVAAILITWLTIQLWRMHRRGEDPKPNEWKNRLYFLTNYFSVSGLTLLLFAIIMLVVIEAASQGCEVQRHVLQGDNWDDFFKWLPDAKTEENVRIINACLRSNSSGSILEAVNIEDDVDETLQALEQAQIDVAESFQAIRNETDLSWVDDLVEFKDDMWMVICNISDPDLHTDAFVAWEESLFGGVQLPDMDIHPKYRTHLNSYVSDVKDKIGAYPTDQQADMLAELPTNDDWVLSYGMTKFETRFNVEASHAQGLCPDVTLNTQWCFVGSGRCGGTTAVINLADVVVIGDSLNGAWPGDVTMSNTDADAVFDCLTSTPDTRVKAIQWASSMFWAVRKLRTLARQPDDRHYAFLKTASPLESLSFEDYSLPGVNGCFICDAVVNISTKSDNLAESTHPMEADSIALLEEPEAFLNEKVIGAYNCLVAQKVLLGSINIVCDDALGDLAFIGLSLLLLAICCGAGWVISWKLWHYFYDREFGEEARGDEELEKELPLDVGCTYHSVDFVQEGLTEDLVEILGRSEPRAEQA